MCQKEDVTSSSANSTKLFCICSTLCSLCSLSSSLAFSDICSKVLHASCCLDGKYNLFQLIEIYQEESSISRQNLNVNLETLHLACTEFIIYLVFILKQDFLIIILCPRKFTISSILFMAIAASIFLAIANSEF